MAERLERLSTELARLEAVVARFHLGVKLHLEDVPEQQRSARLKRASERHRAWLEVVERMVAMPLETPTDDASATSNDAETKPTRARREHRQHR